MKTTNKLDLAKASLQGLSIGDAFGETFFGSIEIISHRINNRVLQEGSWFFTDDTVMVLEFSIFYAGLEQSISITLPNKKLPADYDIRTIVSVLGNGTDLCAHDTVPFALWCVAHHTGSFSEAIWTGISALGDRDTIAAIIGSIVVLSAGPDSIPQQWIIQAEKFSDSRFFNKALL